MSLVPASPWSMILDGPLSIENVKVLLGNCLLLLYKVTSEVANNDNHPCAQSAITAKSRIAVAIWIIAMIFIIRDSIIFHFVGFISTLLVDMGKGLHMSTAHNVFFTHHKALPQGAVNNHFSICLGSVNHSIFLAPQASEPNLLFTIKTVNILFNKIHFGNT